MRVDLGQVARATGGKPRGGGGQITGVTVDSRQVRPGDLFVALRGQRVDGHSYVPDAADRGAGGALVENAGAIRDLLPGVVVPDTQRALEDLALWYASGFSAPVVGVTGSTGKTTVKEMAAAALSAGGPVLATTGNYNTEIGVPLTLFGLEECHRAAVLEMAMRAPGQISRLAEIARPVVGVITNIGVTHMEKLGSREAIARAKGELLQGLGGQQTAILWQEDDFFSYLKSLAPGPVITFGWQASADVWAEHLDFKPNQGRMDFVAATPWGRQPVRLHALGSHNVLNALAAVAVGGTLGWNLETLARGLASYQPPAQRLEVKPGPRGSLILDDTYNANPDSTARGLDALMQACVSGRAIAVLGDMLELGIGAADAHREVGAYAARAGVARLLALGDFRHDLIAGAQEAGMDHRCLESFASPEETINCLQGLLQKGDVCLVKASRGLALERVVQSLALPADSGDPPKSEG